MSLLELKSISLAHGRNRVLHDVDLVLNAGEIVTLIGANGAGKSTVVKTISGLMRATAGSISLNGESIANLSPSQRLRRGVAHVPEGRQIFAGMTVEENLVLGAYATGPVESGHKAFIWDLFPVLRERLSDVAGNLSGGQQQMLAIARGLMSKPRILLLDEPSLGIAPLLVAELFKLIDSLRGQGIAVLLAEQNARQALAIADRGYVFANGRIVLDGSSGELLASAEVAEHYLGVGSDLTESDSVTLDLVQRLGEVMEIDNHDWRPSSMMTSGPTNPGGPSISDRGRRRRATREDGIGRKPDAKER
jgi:branched-chain amino acid transport system ATP-binding protein